ncbi:Protein phosphatase CheZ [Gammaproteobacteria bacterium]
MDQADHDQWLARAQALAEHIKQGNDDEVNRLLDEISRSRQHMLFQELGKLTREFHDALNSFRLDTRVSQLAQENIPDAKQRLNYVIVMTEQAATRTLNAVEKSLPLCEEITTRARSLHDQWLRFTQRTLTATDFRHLSHELSSFLESLSVSADHVRENLSEVLMAQDYQDITGQILQRVIRLVNEMEEHLVRLVRGGSSYRPVEVSLPRSQEREAEPMAEIAAVGPYVPGTATQEEIIHNQDDVDALLSSLGF